MRNSYKILIGITSLAIVGALFYFTRRNNQSFQKRLVEISDEGYETAQDILYPMRQTKRRRASLT